MADDTAQKAQALVDRLRERGHHVEADRIARHLSLRTVERGFLFALREAIETILTAIEALDPATETLAEELRVEVAGRIRLSEAEEGTK